MVLIANTMSTLYRMTSHCRPLVALVPLLTVLALTGCASVAPPSQLEALQARHDVRLPAAAEVPKRAAPGPQLQAQAQTLWWQALNDPLLNDLVQEALTRNLDLRSAMASLQEARALAGLAQREGGPQGSLGVSAQVSRASRPEVDPYRQGLPRPPEQRLVSIGQTLSWELDLFGRIGTAQAVAERELDMARADLQAAQALVQAEVVNRYVQLRAAQQMGQTAERQQALAMARLHQLTVREKAGLADARDRDAAQAELAQRQADVATLRAQAQQSLAALAVLTGGTPAAMAENWPGLTQPAALPALPLQDTLQVSDGLLTRLPQVARADAALRASLGQQVLAERAHLPRLSLSATLGLQEQASRLQQAGALRYAAGPALQWDWLDAGRREARQAAARAGSDRAWAQFENVMLTALAEGESALRGWQAELVGWDQAQAAQTVAAAAARYGEQRARVGLEPALLSLATQSQSLEAEQRLRAQQARALQAYVQVQLALGAWQPQ